MFFLIICCFVFCSSSNLSAQCIYENLHEQVPAFPSPFDGKAFLPSQQFVLFAQGKAFKGADDFEVPNGATWLIDGVDVNGVFSFLNFDGQFCGVSIVEALVAEIYADDDGLPGNLIWREEVPSIINTNSPNFELAFANPASVISGRYWLSVFPIMRNECGNWFWVQSSPGNPKLQPAAFLDQIFNQCNNEWVDGTDDCILNEHFEVQSDLAFTLKTCETLAVEVLSIAPPTVLTGARLSRTTVDLKFSGGNGPYTYKWEANGRVFWNEKAMGVLEIAYFGKSYWKVTATDRDGKVGVFTNDPNPDVDGNEGGLLDVYKVEVSPETGVNKYDGAVKFCIEGGTKPYQIQTSNGKTINNLDDSGCFTLADLAGGSYTIDVTDSSYPNLITKGLGYVHRDGGRVRPGGRNKAVVDGITNVVVFPNPFTYSTNVEFLSTADTFVEVNIYDVNGQKVESLFSQDAEAGEAYRLHFNASTLRSGIYFVQLTTGDEVITQKMLLY
ncbi:MAG: T9SS type A sorting domain-containing protein [Chitinophagales bacterium]